jgi:hypothetical protein
MSTQKETGIPGLRVAQIIAVSVARRPADRTGRQDGSGRAPPIGFVGAKPRGVSPYRRAARQVWPGLLPTKV